jgi:hypothetical protein
VRRVAFYLPVGIFSNPRKFATPLTGVRGHNKKVEPLTDVVSPTNAAKWGWFKRPGKTGNVLPRLNAGRSWDLRRKGPPSTCLSDKQAP